MEKIEKKYETAINLITFLTKNIGQATWPMNVELKQKPVEAYIQGGNDNIACQTLETPVLNIMYKFKSKTSKFHLAIPPSSSSLIFSRVRRGALLLPQMSPDRPVADLFIVIFSEPDARSFTPAAAGSGFVLSFRVTTTQRFFRFLPDKMHEDRNATRSNIITLTFEYRVYGGGMNQPACT